MDDCVLGPEEFDNVFNVGWERVEVDDFVEFGLGGVLLNQSNGLRVMQFIGVHQHESNIHGFLFLLDLGFKGFLWCWAGWIGRAGWIGWIGGTGGISWIGGGAGLKSNIIADEKSNVDFAVSFMSDD